ncbi:universal stress protein [Skermanella mucosa]|uniref:universal stress protein n=1 Tax=Skermanella mucosa TaxID=1789672 RepID=UPI00192AD5DB|nr:universal stress protein [Skermanella mucosa]UEM20878.1 universal stress protein [Skermanella mucosa]
MIRKILAPLDGQPSDRTSLALAFDMARLLDAHVEGVFLATDPAGSIPIMGEAVPPEFIDEMIREREEAVAAAGREAERCFDRVRQAAALPLAEAPGAGTGGASAWFHMKLGNVERTLARIARCADLTVLPQGDRPFPGTLARVRDAVLFDAGRPLLLAPAVPVEGLGPVENLGKVVAIAWNDSAEATHAIIDALPLLTRASKVLILVQEDFRRQIDGAVDLAAYLAWHGIDAAIDRLPRVEEEPMGQVLTQRALDLGAGLLVMGAYGHSRFREMVLGGTTRHVLENPARIPVLMAH